MTSNASNSRGSVTSTEAVRIDQWLWAARFYKTRSVAKAAIEGGMVHCDGVRVKCSKEIKIGYQLTIRQKLDVKTVEVTALSTVRRGAPEAALLYQETPESISQRLHYAEQRKLNNLARPDHKPNKKDRRQWVDLQKQNFSEF